MLSPLQHRREGPLGSITGGGGLSVSPSSTATAGPSKSGDIGGDLFNFGGINLGNQDIPLSGSTAAGDHSIPTIGTLPGQAGAGFSTALTLPGGGQIFVTPTTFVFVAAAGLLLWALLKRR